jgi:hypothetical protein
MSKQTKTIGRAVGILYILGTVFGILGVAVTSSISSSDDVLGAAASHETELALGALLIVAMGSVLAMIPVVAYPILGKVDTLLARGYFLFRSVFEATTHLLVAAGWLLLITLSRSTEVPQVWGEALFDAKGLAVVGTIAFLTGAAMFYLILYRARLVPRWLSVWGLVAIVPYLVPVFLGLFSDGVVNATSTTTVLLDIPLGLQEMVLAVWLIVKGFASDRVPLQDQPGS